VRERVGAFFAFVDLLDFEVAFFFVDFLDLLLDLVELDEWAFFTLCLLTVTTLVSDQNPRSVLVFLVWPYQE
jgi:hypothetical protein